MFGNMADLFGKVQEMQQKATEMKDQLAKQTFTAEAGGGMVHVKVNGLKQVLTISFNKDLIALDDLELLGDIVAAAINKAQSEVDESSKNSLGDMTKNLMPGFDLSKLGL